MPVMDEFKEEREQIKNRSFKEKCSYFWDYYKWHVIGGIIGVFVIVSLIHTFVSRKPTAFYAAFMNMSPVATVADEYKQGFADAAGIDTDKNTVYFDTDMHLDLTKMDDVSVSTTQKMMVYVAAGDLDVMIADTAGMDHYAYNQIMMDMHDFLSPEDYAKYEPYFYYIDRALLEDAEQLNSVIPYPENPEDPALMKDPMPVGIRVNDCVALGDSYYFGGYHYFCVFVNSQKMDYAHSFLDYVWDVPAEVMEEAHEKFLQNSVQE